VWSEAKGALVDDADFDKAANSAFPVGNGAGEVFERGAVSVPVSCCGWSPTQPRSAATCAFEHPGEGADETAFAVGEVGPPLLSFRMCCLHAREGKTGRGTFLGLCAKKNR
jgi:hypothetical protein